jgi:hypothetical protein
VDQGNGVNGSGAVYVFSRTGTAWRQDAYLKGSRSEGNDALGFSVAVSGDGSTIVAGAGDESCLVGGINPQGCDMDKPKDASGGSAGAAYVWVRSGSRWTEQAFIKASNPDLQDLFGANLAVSSDGNTLLVGAAMEDSRARGVNGQQQDNSATESGAAYLFTRSGTTWRQQAYTNGRRLIVGARMESGGAAGINGNQSDNSTPQAGALYVWEMTP